MVNKMRPRNEVPGLFILSTLSLMLAVALQANAANVDVEFDTDALKARGFDPRIAEEFRSGSRFPAGMNRVTLMVNGQNRGKADIRFTPDGKMCLTEALLQQGQLDKRVFRSHSEQACVTPQSLWEKSSAISIPGDGVVELVVPESAIMNGEDYLSWGHGGSGALVNYGLQYMNSRSAGTAVTYRQVQTEAGFNMADWLFRTTQDWSDFGGEKTLRHKNAWVQKTLYDHKSIFQAGRIDLSIGSTAGGRVMGMQVMPETALYGQEGAAVVTGIADDIAVVEIRQQNILLHRTTVPQGTFELRGFSLLNLTSNLDVTVINSDGSRQAYQVPPAAYRTGEASVRQGISWGIGRWDQDGFSRHPWVAGISKGWQLWPRVGVQSDLFVAESYQALSLSSDMLLPSGQNVSLSVTGTSSSAHSGGRGDFTVSQSLPGNVSLGFNGTLQSDGFQEFSETLAGNDPGTRVRSQFGPSLNWAHDQIGNLSFSWYRTLQNDGRHSDYVQLGWSRRIAGAYLSVSAGRSYDSVQGRGDNRLYATLQIPLGRSSAVTGYMNRNGNQNRYGSRYNWRQSQSTNWSFSAEQSEADNRRSLSGAVSTTTPWTRIGGNLSADSQGARSLSLQGSGGVLLAQGDMLFTPYPIGDTFGTVSVDGLSNVKIDTPAGPVWTNGKGKAVLPSLTSWKTSTIALDTRSLKKDSDVINASEEIRLARGAVGQIGFGVVSTRRVLVSVKDEQGHHVPSRAMVYDEAGKFVSVTNENGTLFINDAYPGMKLEVESGERSCFIHLRLPERRADNAGLYEEITAICR